MRRYHQLTSEERYALTALRRQGFSIRGIARALDRAPSTISREIRRNRRKDGWYRAFTADERARARRSRSRRNRRFGSAEWALVEASLREQWSPEQIAGWFRRFGILSISHETIYRYVWEDRMRGGTIYLHLRFSSKQRRKRYGHYDSRGRLAGKRHISERPPGAENRSRIGHLEGDTVLGSGDTHCILTLVDRRTGYLMIGKLTSRTVKDTNRRAIALIMNAPRRVRTITVDHGTEFHGYKAIEEKTGALFFFATPYHSWERGTSENTNGLIRQYLPKRKSMAKVSQRTCSRIAHKLNNRPRKRLGYRTPRECYEESL
jgi:IS30 family transposase